MSVKKRTEAEGDAAVSAIMAIIDKHEFATPNVKRIDTIAFYQCISESCLERAQLITREALDAGEDIET